MDFTIPGGGWSLSVEVDVSGVPEAVVVLVGEAESRDFESIKRMLKGIEIN